MRNTFGLLAFSATSTATATATSTALRGPQQAVKNVNKRNLNASQTEIRGSEVAGKLGKPG